MIARVNIWMGDDLLMMYSPPSVCMCVQAMDADQGLNGEVHYRLLSHSDLFRISANGSIWTAVALDREQREHYEVVVEASDAAPDPRRTSVTLSVTVLDINDNSPVFSQPSYSVILPENNPPNMTILNLTVSF